MARALIALAGIALWFTVSSLLTLLFGNGVFGLLITGCYVLLETPLLQALGGEHLPMPLGAQMSGTGSCTTPLAGWLPPRSQSCS
ncbi:MAG: hypothetical protein ACOYEV_02435 [Candidatus Nanopelagicales bacterium]